MARKYSKEEKQEHLKKFKASGKTRGAYAKANGIPEATFRSWVKIEREEKFGVIEVLGDNQQVLSEATTEEAIVFRDKYIKIELKEGYNKEVLKEIIEVVSK